jgi:hypothetical protein
MPSSDFSVSVNPAANNIVLSTQTLGEWRQFTSQHRQSICKCVVLIIKQYNHQLNIQV